MERGITLIIPAYNEATRLPEALTALRHQLEQTPLHRPCEVILVSDGSRDNTVAIAKEYITRLPHCTGHIIELPTNQGKGGAIQAGIHAARHELTLFADADGATDWSELVITCKLADQLFPAMIIGSRNLPESRKLAPRPLTRRITGKLASYLVRFGIITQIADTQCGWKCFPTAWARSVLGPNSERGFFLDVELIQSALRARLPIVEHAVMWREVPGTTVRFFRDFRRLLTALWRLRRAARHIPDGQL